MSVQAVKVGDAVDVLSYSEHGVEGGTVVALVAHKVRLGARQVKVPSARIRRADGTEFVHAVRYLVPR